MATKVYGDEAPPLTECQIKALCALSYTWPLPEGYLDARHGIHTRELLPLIEQGFARYVILRDAVPYGGEEYGPFLVLTLDGAKAREAELDWISKHKPSEGWRARLLRAVGREQ